MKILIKNIIGTNCITQEDGQKIYDLICNYSLKNEEIILDFEGIKYFAAPFFNFAFGKLLKDIKLRKLISFLSFNNIPTFVKVLIDHILENLDIYYRDSQYREVINNVICKNLEVER